MAGSRSTAASPASAALGAAEIGLREIGQIDQAAVVDEILTRRCDLALAYDLDALRAPAGSRSRRSATR
jgi:hypothetical protein